MKIIPFDFYDGRTAGEFYSILLDKRQNFQIPDRNVIKDDCKLLSQIFNRSIEAYITKDRRSFNQIIAPVTSLKGFSIELIDLAIPLKDYMGKLF